MSLDFSEVKLVYFQPLWLEAIDFLWEGLLGTAVWGGAAEVEADAVSDSGESWSFDDRARFAPMNPVHTIIGIDRPSFGVRLFIYLPAPYF